MENEELFILYMPNVNMYFSSWNITGISMVMVDDRQMAKRMNRQEVDKNMKLMAHPERFEVIPF